MELTDAIRAYVEEKINHLDKFLDPTDESIEAQVEVGKTTEHHQKGQVFRAEINLHLRGKYLRVEQAAEDLYAAIDLARDEMAREIKGAKEKNETLFRRGARKIKNLLRFGRGNAD